MSSFNYSTFLCRERGEKASLYRGDTENPEGGEKNETERPSTSEKKRVASLANGLLKARAQAKRGNPCRKELAKVERAAGRKQRVG